MSVNSIRVADSSIPAICSGYDLEKAIDRENSQDTVEAIVRGDLLNQPLSNGYLPLHYAIRREKLELVQLMLEQLPVDMSSKDDQGLSAIDHAMIGKNPQMISLCLGHSIGRDFDAVRTQPVSSSHRQKIREIRLEAENLRSGALFGKLPPLHDAAKKGNLDVIKSAYKEGADLDVYDQHGMTPLHHAVLAGNLGVVKWFLKHHRQSTQVLARNEGYTYGKILKAKCLQGSPKAQKLSFLAQNEGRSVLHFAALGGDSLIIENLFKRHDVQRGVDTLDATGRTPLHYAAALENLSGAKILVEKGADPFEGRGSFSPMQMMLVLADELSEKRDPLHLSTSQVAIFSCMATSLITKYCQDVLPMSDTIRIGAQCLPFLIGSRGRTERIATAVAAGTIYVVSMLFLGAYLNCSSIYSGECSSIVSMIPFIQSGNTTPLRLALLGASSLQGLRYFNIAKSAFSGLAACWKNRCVETYRPIRNAFIHFVNSASVIDGIGSTINRGLDGYKLLDVWDKQMETQRELFQSIRCQFVEIQITSYWTEKFKVQNELSLRLEYIKDFLHNYWYPSKKETLIESGDAKTICENKTEADCIRALNPKDPEHAWHILRLSGIIDSCKKAYRLMSLRWHPDRPSGDHSVFVKVQESSEVAGCSR